MIEPGQQALVRFGLGRAPGEPLPANPRAWAAAQLADPDPGPPGAPLADAFLAIAADREERRDPAADTKPEHARTLFLAERAALLNHALTTRTPFRERLVWFWANHFTVSTRNGNTAPLVGDYVRTAIRPNVTATFADMLLAVMRHPAMLLYLDQNNSAGPNSLAASRDKHNRRNINENLARESLELHTVSPAVGYTQADVTAYATVLAGFSVDEAHAPAGFRFNPNLAEPGPKTVLAHHVDEGEPGATAFLLLLANHPATHRHLATKLVRHFVADTPPPAAIDRVANTLRSTGGNLAAAALALLTLDDAWASPLAKLRSPQDFLVAALRAAPLPDSLPPEKRPDVAGILGGLGQPPFAATFPVGWPDTAADWAGPEALLRRIDWAYGYAARPNLPEPAAVLETALGPLASAETANAVRRAGSRRDALTLLLGSPEFQRR